VSSQMNVFAQNYGARYKTTELKIED